MISIEQDKRDMRVDHNHSWTGKTVVIDGDWLAFLAACLTHVKHTIAKDSLRR